MCILEEWWLCIFQMGKRMYLSRRTRLAIEAEWDKEDDEGIGWDEEKSRV